MYYVHKIYYLDWYRNQQKKENCGFVKMEATEQKTNFSFAIRNLKYVGKNTADVKLYTANGSEKIGYVKIKNNKIYETISVPKCFQEQAIEKIEIQVSQENKICYVNENNYINEVSIISKNNINNNEIKKMDNKETKSINKTVTSSKEINEIAAAEELPQISEVKWEQLKNIYPTVHIFGENTDTILIKPQDLVILPEEYQDLTTNSFLLHGYYNYRQLLLSQWITERGIEYFIGVPGTFYEREKNIAIMFGFESFENGESSRREQNNRLYPGHFGYYMKKVEI